MDLALQQVVRLVTDWLVLESQGDMVGDGYEEGGTIDETCWRVIRHMIKTGVIDRESVEFIMKDNLVEGNDTVEQFNTQYSGYWVRVPLGLDLTLDDPHGNLWLESATLAVYSFVYDQLPIQGV